jgi:hypothetical protein
MSTPLGAWVLVNAKACAQVQFCLRHKLPAPGTKV